MQVGRVWYWIISVDTLKVSSIDTLPGARAVLVLKLQSFMHLTPKRLTLPVGFCLV